MTSTIQRIVHLASRRGLEFVLIGGNAVLLSGFARTTVDVDLMIASTERSRWLDLMREMGYKLFNGTEAFAQFEAGAKGLPGIDLMFVASATWEKIRAAAEVKSVGDCQVLVPAPAHLVAMKLHAAVGANRGNPETDWEDIRQLVRLHHLDPADPEFRALVLKHGGELALTRVASFLQ